MFEDYVKSWYVFDLAALFAAFAAYLLRKKRTASKNHERLRQLKKFLQEFKPEPLIDAKNLPPSKFVEYRELDRLDLTSSNFLNFLNNEDIRNDAEECIKRYGIGSCGPRGFFGTSDAHIEAEVTIAKFLGTEEAIVYSCGCSTVMSAVKTYCTERDTVFYGDRTNFSIVQGVASSKSKLVSFKHDDVVDLEKMVMAHENGRGKRILIVEGICANTGKICPLPRLVELCKLHTLRIFVDESLSLGVLGKTGKGVTEYHGVDVGDVDMLMGSLENALGSVGGFCAGSSALVEYQRLFSLSYCFSASPPPFLAQAVVSAIKILESKVSVLQDLMTLSIQVDSWLHACNYEVISDKESPLKVVGFKPERRHFVDYIYEYCKRQKIRVIKGDYVLKFNLGLHLCERNVNRMEKVFKGALERVSKENRY